jgi:hypothetical protein
MAENGNAWGSLLEEIQTRVAFARPMGGPGRLARELSP